MNSILFNAIIFDERLTNQAKLLLVAMSNLNIQQKDLQKRSKEIQEQMNWGKHKLQKAISVCIEHGYLK